VKRRPIAAAICLAGAGALRASFVAEPGSRRFYALTGQVALTWLLGSAALSSGRRDTRTAATHPVATHPVATPPLATSPLATRSIATIPGAVAIGAAAFGAFYAAARIARHIGPLRRALAHVLRYAEHESPLVLITTLTNGAAEEIFFRGALYDTASTRPALSSTVAYVLVTSASGNPALALASAVMGTLFAVQRKHSGTVIAPLITHLVWSTLMVSFLPREAGSAASTGAGIPSAG
jgi:membrane protease YdiL (CAAX protease family)